MRSAVETASCASATVGRSPERRASASLPSAAVRARAELVWTVVMNSRNHGGNLPSAAGASSAARVAGAKAKSAKTGTGEGKDGGDGAAKRAGRASSSAG